MVTKEVLKDFVENNPKLVTRKESTRYPGLFVLKYSRRVFFDNLWTDVLEECRGTVIDADWNIVVAPPTKIYNHFENNTTIDRDEDTLAVEKINGFMCAVTYVEGHGVIVSTTGSLDSDFVTLAEKYITPIIKGEIERDGRDTTFFFEICAPEDPHIVPEKEGAYLLGARFLPATDDYFSTAEHEKFLDEAAIGFGVKRPKWKVARFSDVCAEAKVVKHEGFVCYGQVSKTALKIKSPYYLTQKMFARKKDIMSLDKARMEEEYYPLREYLLTIADEFNAMEEQERLDVMRKFLEN